VCWEHGSIILLSIIVELGKQLHATQSSADFTQYGLNNNNRWRPKERLSFYLVSRSIATDVSLIIYRTLKPKTKVLQIDIVIK